MLGSLVVTMREGFEAALVIGIVLAYLRQAGAGDRARFVWAGVAAAGVVSVVAAGILFASGHDLKGRAEAVYEGTAMLLAAVVLTWMIFWMQRQARTLGADLRGRVADALRSGRGAVFWVAFVAVAREGIETALFVYAAAGKSSGAATIAGVVIGLAVATVLGIGVYHGSKRLNLGAFFRITSVLLLAFAAYLIRGGLDELAEATRRDAFETLALVVALIYVVTMVWVYLRTSGALHKPVRG